MYIYIYVYENRLGPYWDQCANKKHTHNMAAKSPSDLVDLSVPSEGSSSLPPSTARAASTSLGLPQQQDFSRFGCARIRPYPCRSRGSRSGFQVFYTCMAQWSLLEFDMS